MQYTSLSALCINTLLTNLFQSAKVTVSPQQTVASLLWVFQTRRSTKQEIMFYQELKSQANIGFSLNLYSLFFSTRAASFNIRVYMWLPIERICVFHMILYVAAYTVYLCVPHNSHNKQRLFPSVALSVGLSLGRTHVSSHVWEDYLIKYNVQSTRGL
jgi:hypothetical protein